MTKFTKLSDLLGQEEKPKGKPIEFNYFISEKFIVESTKDPRQWDNVVYLGKDYSFDLFMCYNNVNPQEKAIYRGHLNDGFIEQ